MRCIEWNVINVCWNDVGVLDRDGDMHVWLIKLPTGSFPWLSLGSYLFCSVRNEILQSPKSQTVRAGIPSMRTPAFERNDFSFCRTVWNWSLFLAHPTYWQKRVTSENTQDTSWGWFRVFKVSRKIRVLKQSKSALLCCVSHMPILFEFTCMMNGTRSNVLTVCHKTLSTLWPHARKFIHRPQNIRSQKQTFQNNRWANCRQFSYWLIFFFFELLIIDARAA